MVKQRWRTWLMCSTFAPVAASQVYSAEAVVDDLGQPLNAFAMDMNEAGDIVGFESPDSGATAIGRGFRARANGGFEWLDTPVGMQMPIVYLWKTSEAGFVAGSVTDGSDLDAIPTPVIWDAAGTLIELPIPHGFVGGAALAVNDMGVVVGSLWAPASPLQRYFICGICDGLSAPSVGFRWSAGAGMEILPAPPTGSALLHPFAVTNSGRIAGLACRGVSLSGGSTAITQAAFLDEADGSRQWFIAPQPDQGFGVRLSGAYDLSESGYLAGYTQSPGNIPFLRGPDGATFSFSEPIFSQSFAWRVNESGQTALVATDGTLRVWSSDGSLVVLSDQIVGGLDDRFIFFPGALSNDATRTYAMAGDLRLEQQVVLRINRLDMPSPCPADVNADGTLNGADFNAWLAAFSQGLDIADQNDDGNLNGADFNAWLANFAAGCE